MYRLLKKLLRVKKQPPIHIRPDKPGSIESTWTDESIVKREDALLEAVYLHDTMGFATDENGIFIKGTFPPLRQSSSSRLADPARPVIPFPPFAKGSPVTNGIPTGNPWADSQWDAAHRQPSKLICTEVSDDSGYGISTCTLPRGHDGAHIRGDHKPWLAPRKPPKPIVVNEALNRPITGRKDLEEIEEGFKFEEAALKARHKKQLKVIKELVDEHFPEDEVDTPK